MDKPRKMLQDKSDINGTVIEDLFEKFERLEEQEKLERPFEYYEKELQGRITELKEAYKTKSSKEYTESLKKDIEYLIQKSEKTAKLELLDKKGKLQKQVRRYTILINVANMVTWQELNLLLGDAPQSGEGNKLEEEILELKEEIPSKGYLVTPQGPTSDGILLEGKVRHMKGTLMRKDLYEKLKRLREDSYEEGKLDEKGVKELRVLLEEARKKGLGFGDIEYSLNLLEEKYLGR